MQLKNSRFVLIATLSAFVAAVLLDPSDQMLHMKVPLLILTLSVWGIRVALGMVSPGSSKIWAAILLFSLILPGLASIIALLGDTLPVGELHFQVMKSFAVILLIPVVLSERIDLLRHIRNWSFVVAAFTLVLVVSSLVNPLFCAAAYNFFNEKQNVFTHITLGFGVGSFYYKTIAILVFPIAYHFHNLLNQRKKFHSALLMLIFTAAALGSGSRGVAVGVFFVFLLLGFQKFKTKFGPGAALSLLFVALVAPAGYFAGFFHPQDSSNAAKLGHIRSYATEFEDHPAYLLWGQGTDTLIYSEGFRFKVNETELTYLDLVRWFGIPVTLVILIPVLYPAFGLARRSNGESYLAVPYIAYLWEATTNPLLICSFGALLVSAIWGLILMHDANKTFDEPAEALS